jgi:Uma2 family endonuclease
MRTPFNFPRYTYNDYKNWKEDWELVDGYPLQLLPSASFKHNKTIISLIYQSKLALNKNEDCNCEIFSELDWKINDETVVRPDMMIICGDMKTDFLEFPPVLVIEVISPNSIKRDRVIKFDLYREQGVKYYLMLDYTKQTIEVFELIDNYYKEVNKSKFLLDKTCEIEFDFDSIWK